MIQPCTSVEQLGWLAMRQALWPHASRGAHIREMAALLAAPGRYCQFVAYTPEGAPAGFVEAAIRTDYVNGTTTSPVAFLEGLFVEPAARGRGMARALVHVVQDWARRQGCRELASDALLDNVGSHAMHRALGFEETERVVYFCQALPREPPPHDTPDRAPGSEGQTAVRAATPSDADAIADIYNHYIRDTIVTFEEEPVDADEMARRMADVEADRLPWLVADLAGRTAGYAYATRWRSRVGYRFSSEITVYLAPSYHGLGIGSHLYAELFARLNALGLHAVMGGIALPNDRSVALHEKFGMRKVAHFEQVGFKFDRWIDVGFWQRVLRAGSG